MILCIAFLEDVHDSPRCSVVYYNDACLGWCMHGPRREKYLVSFAVRLPFRSKRPGVLPAQSEGELQPTRLQAA
jgi:hypothetical protein